jgi:hypothetical protein
MKGKFVRGLINKKPDDNGDIVETTHYIYNPSTGLMKIYIRRHTDFWASPEKDFGLILSDLIP